MKFKISIFLPLLAVLFSGCVVSNTPVGDKVAELKPAVWNAKWRDGNGEIGWTKIKDAKLGVVEVGTSEPWPGLARSTQEILVRNLGPLVIANEKSNDAPGFGYEFGRLSIDAKHLVVFGANEPSFASLVKRHEIAGKLDKDKDGKPNGSCFLERFSDKDYRRLKEEGFDVRSLFNEDPDTVLVRDKWTPFWW